MQVEIKYSGKCEESHVTSPHQNQSQNSDWVCTIAVLVALSAIGPIEVVQDF